MRTLRARHGRGAVAGILLFGAVAVLCGCYAQRSATVLSGVGLSELRSFRVERGRSEVIDIAALIEADLGRRGLEVRDGESGGAAAVVRYEALWVWDFGRYLTGLRIDLRDPATNVLLATGQSYRATLSRQAPDVVVREVLDEIFAGRES